MYDKIKAFLGQEDETVESKAVDPKIVQEIVGYYQESLNVTSADDLSDELLDDAYTIYLYLASGRTIFGGGR